MLIVNLLVTNREFLILTNLIVPSVTALFYLIFFLYFILAKPAITRTYKYFTLHLITFSLFLFGRPLQLLAGSFPMPLVINNLRLLLLSSLAAPAILLATNIIEESKKIQGIIVITGIGFLFGLAYSLFNTLGTTGSYEVFRLGNIIAYDNLTPSLRSPFYGREVTIAVQVAIGFFLFLSPFLSILRLMKITGVKRLLHNNFFVIDCGIMIFAVSLTIGSLVQQWWIYYIGSIASAIVLGAGVVSDIKAAHLKLERLIPYINEEIMQGISLNDLSNQKIAGMLVILEKQGSMDTFLAVKINNQPIDEIVQKEQYKKIFTLARKILQEELDEENFLIIPLSGNKIGITLSLTVITANKKFILDNFLDKMCDVLFKRTGAVITMGVGRTYAELTNLRVSYYEALSSLEHSGQAGKRFIVHIEELRQLQEKSAKYPLVEKEELVSAVKTGNSDAAGITLNKFFIGFREFSRNKPGAVKARIYELLSALIEAAAKGSQDEERLHELALGYFNDIEHLKDMAGIELWLQKVCTEIIRVIHRESKSRSKMIIQKAKLFIENNYQNQITVKNAADAVMISPSYFLHLFKQVSGETFTDYLTRTRIAKAKALLLGSTFNITEIAYRAGYSDSNYFSTVFKNSEGMTPSAYRKRCNRPH